MFCWCTPAAGAAVAVWRFLCGLAGVAASDEQATASNATAKKDVWGTHLIVERPGARLYYLCTGGALNSASVTSASHVMPPRLMLNCVPPALGDAPCQWTTPGGQ